MCARSGYCRGSSARRKKAIAVFFILLQFGELARYFQHDEQNELNFDRVHESHSDGDASSRSASASQVLSSATAQFLSALHDLADVLQSSSIQWSGRSLIDPDNPTSTNRSRQSPGGEKALGDELIYSKEFSGTLETVAEEGLDITDLTPEELVKVNTARKILERLERAKAANRNLVQVADASTALPAVPNVEEEDLDFSEVQSEINSTEDNHSAVEEGENSGEEAQVQHAETQTEALQRELANAAFAVATALENMNRTDQGGDLRNKVVAYGKASNGLVQDAAAVLKESQESCPEDERIACSELLSPELEANLSATMIQNETADEEDASQSMESMAEMAEALGAEPTDMTHSVVGFKESRLNEIVQDNYARVEICLTSTSIDCEKCDNESKDLKEWRECVQKQIVGAVDAKSREAEKQAGKKKIAGMTKDRIDNSDKKWKRSKREAALRAHDAVQVYGLYRNWDKWGEDPTWPLKSFQDPGHQFEGVTMLDAEAYKELAQRHLQEFQMTSLQILEEEGRREGGQLYTAVLEPHVDAAMAIKGEGQQLLADGKQLQAELAPLTDDAMSMTQKAQEVVAQAKEAQLRVMGKQQKLMAEIEKCTPPGGLLQLSAQPLPGTARLPPQLQPITEPQRRTVMPQAQSGDSPEGLSSAVNNAEKPRLTKAVEGVENLDPNVDLPDSMGMGDCDPEAFQELSAEIEAEIENAEELQRNVQDLQNEGMALKERVTGDGGVMEKVETLKDKGLELKDKALAVGEKSVKDLTSQDTINAIIKTAKRFASQVVERILHLLRDIVRRMALEIVSWLPELLFAAAEAALDFITGFGWIITAVRIGWKLGRWALRKRKEAHEGMTSTLCKPRTHLECCESTLMGWHRLYEGRHFGSFEEFQDALKSQLPRVKKGKSYGASCPQAVSLYVDEDPAIKREKVERARQQAADDAGPRGQRRLWLAAPPTLAEDFRKLFNRALGKRARRSFSGYPFENRSANTNEKKKG